MPGSPGAVDTIEEAQKLAVDIGFPLLVKAASGGGGRGMKVANSADELSEPFPLPAQKQKRPSVMTRFILNGTWITRAILKSK